MNTYRVCAIKGKWEVYEYIVNAINQEEAIKFVKSQDNANLISFIEVDEINTLTEGIVFTDYIGE